MLQASASHKPMAAGPNHAVFLLPTGEGLREQTCATPMVYPGPAWLRKVVKGPASGNNTVLYDNRCLAVSVGDQHTVYMMSDGTLSFVGSSDAGEDAYRRDPLSKQHQQIREMLNVKCSIDAYRQQIPMAIAQQKCCCVQVAAGRAHTVLLMADQTVKAFGSNSNHQCEVKEDFECCAIAAGGNTTAMLSVDRTRVLVSGELSRFLNGSQEVSLRELPGGYLEIEEKDPESRYTQVAVGPKHIVLLRNDGKVRVLCINAQAPWTQQIPEAPLKSEVTWKRVAAGADHTLLLRSDGKVDQYGGERRGALFQCTFHPPPGMTFTEIWCGSDYGFMLSSDGSVECTLNKEYDKTNYSKHYTKNGVGRRQPLSMMYEGDDAVLSNPLSGRETLRIYMAGTQDPLKLRDQYYKMLPRLPGDYQVFDRTCDKDLHQLCREQRRSLDYSSFPISRVRSIIEFHKVSDDRTAAIFKELPAKRRQDLQNKFKLSLESLQKRRRKHQSMTELPSYTE